jgi:glyoxylase-like metal-dependent hydrolase (beta-lactamase superfamily II)
VSIEITGQLQWQAWRERVLPPVEKVSDGLWSIPVPIPLNPLRYVLVYALECRDGLVLIDAGWDDDASWLALTDGIGSIGYGIRDVQAVLVTHHHPDHLGLAHRVREASGAWIALHRLDAELVRSIGSPAERDSGLLRHLVRHGVPADEARHTTSLLSAGSWPEPALPDVLLEDGEAVRLPGLDVKVIWTPGHSPGHSCFYQPDRRLLFSGDHVLPRITPQIAVYSQTAGNPLGDFLRSLQHLEQFEVDEVLPAHEYRFAGLPERLVQLARHHTERLAGISAAVGDTPGRTARELSSALAWSRSWESFDVTSRTFALAETVAHLVLLHQRGEVVHHDEDPVRWYPATVPE